MTISNGSEDQTIENQNKFETDESWAIELINECKLEMQEVDSLLEALNIPPPQPITTTINTSAKKLSKPVQKSCNSSDNSLTAIEIQMIACSRKKQADLLKPILKVKKAKGLKSLFRMA